MNDQKYEPTFAIWNKKSEKGHEYLSMKTPDGKWIKFFKNRNKNSEKSPDWFQAKDLNENNKDDGSVPF